MTDPPGRLQATFVPDEGAFAWWWPVSEPAAEPASEHAPESADLTDAVRTAGLPPGRHGICRFAVPVGARIVDVGDAACPCGNETFEVAVGFAVRADGEVRWVSIGLRCVRDGVLGVSADWKISYSPTVRLFDQV